MYQTMGPLRFLVFVAFVTAVIVAVVLVDSWLSGQIGWPERYGFECPRKGCIFVEWIYSGRLLKTGNFRELLLFAWLWIGPFVTVSIVFGAWLKRRTSGRRGRIRPMQRKW
jgi:hypothetical protein